MPHTISFRVFTLFTLFVISASTALAQSGTDPARGDNTHLSDWQIAQQVGSSNHRLYVVTLDQPQRRQSCRVRSFTADKLVCSRGLGTPRTYRRQEIVALIVPGDHDLRIQLLVGLNIGMGAAIWATVVLAAACPACAVGTGVAALLLFCAAGAIGFVDGQEDRVLYLARGQELTVELR
jgi:hypothetical protein